jgi:uncharacterized membrane protein YfcA
VTRAPVTAFVLGVVGGSVSALLGVSAGLIIGPALMLLLGTSRTRAAGTSLLAALPLAAAAAYRYQVEAGTHHERGIMLGAVLWLAAGEVLGALLAARALPRGEATLARRIAAGLVVAVGLWMAAQPFLGGRPVDASNVSGAAALGVGALAGAVSAALGAGGGLVTVPALVLLLHLPQRMAQGTALAAIAAVSLATAGLHLLARSVVWPLAVWLVVGGAVGTFFCAGAAFAVPEAALQALFGAFLVVTGVVRLSGRRAVGAQDPKE